MEIYKPEGLTLYELITGNYAALLQEYLVQLPMRLEIPYKLNEE